MGSIWKLYYLVWIPWPVLLLCRFCPRLWQTLHQGYGSPIDGISLQLVSFLTLQKDVSSLGLLHASTENLEGCYTVACFFPVNLISGLKWCWIVLCSFQEFQLQGTPFPCSMFNLWGPSQRSCWFMSVRVSTWHWYALLHAHLGDSGLSSDVGWGCTLRSGQMMMAQVRSIGFPRRLPNCPYPQYRYECRRNEFKALVVEGFRVMQYRHGI